MANEFSEERGGINRPSEQAGQLVSDTTSRRPLAIRPRLWLHLWTLPRWFALPIAVLGVLLGGLMDAGSQSTAMRLALVVLSAGLVMAWAHAMNAFLDYTWTKLDRGEGRSRSKPYTGGQQPLADGLVTEWEVLSNALSWFALSIIPVVMLSHQGYGWLWLFWAVGALCTFAYSWGKLHWLCETVLAIGFGLVPVMMGAAVTDHPNYVHAGLVSIPFGLLFGFAAEIVDQHYDAEGNWDKGLRNIGAWCWKAKRHVGIVTGLFVGLAVVAHALLVIGGILSPLTFFALIAIVPGVAVLPIMPLGSSRVIMVGLGSIFAYCVALVALQAVAVRF